MVPEWTKEPLQRHSLCSQQQKLIHYVTLRLVFTADVSQVAAALQCVQQVAVVQFSCGVGFVPARNLRDLNVTCKTIRLPLQLFGLSLCCILLFCFLS